ncbi:MAG: glycosyltransferase [Planctomycetaceae bacterium]
MSTTLDHHTGQHSIDHAEAAVKRIGVCHVSMHLATGGLERLLVEFSRLYDNSRFCPQFVAMSDLGQPADEIRGYDCEANSLRFDQVGKLTLLRTLARRLRDDDVQIVHTHNTYAHFYGTLAARWAGVPVVINTQHGRGCGPTWKHRLQFRIANRWTQQVVAVSDDALNLCRRDDPRAASRMMRIWNGINLTRFAYRERPVTNGPPVAISVARLSPEKDFPTLLNAVAEVVKEVPDFRLQLVGDGIERGKLEKLSSELNLKNHVEFLGERSDVPALLDRAGFFVSSSRTEGISLTLLEASAVGLPIVTTAVGGNPEIVEEGQTGRLVPSENPKALAIAIIDMCHNRSQWPEMGRLGRHRVETAFEIGRMVREYEQLYDQLLLEQTGQ